MNIVTITTYLNHLKRKLDWPLECFILKISKFKIKNTQAVLIVKDE